MLDLFCAFWKVEILITGNQIIVHGFDSYIHLGNIVMFLCTYRTGFEVWNNVPYNHNSL